MGGQPSSRRDGFGTEGIGDDDNDSDIGTRGHSSQGGTAGTRTGGTRGNDAGAQSRSGNPPDRQSSREGERQEKNE
jgi:hypothetical protein